MIFYKLLLQQCLRAREVWVSLVLIASLGVGSIFLGHQHLKKQQAEIAEVSTYQKQHFDRQTALHNEDLGLLLYYTKFAYINTLNPLAGVSVGQSDIHPTVKQLTIKTFEAQRFESGLHNPVNLITGHLDLAFVIIYLFPLLVIVLTFNLLSEETETGTWKLITIQAKSKLGFLVSKLLIRVMVLVSLLLVLFLTAKLVLHIPVNTQFLVVILLSVFYVLFWFSVAFFVISLKKSTGFNALLLLSSWLVMMILVPAMVNAYVASKYPVPEALQTAIAQRDGYHTKWDTDKKATIEKFYHHYPAFRSYGYPTDGFNWLWYYAMQQMGDDDSQSQQESFDQKITDRQQTSQQMARFIPNMHIQLAFNQLAGTSMRHQMEYLNGAESFHERLRLFFYPKVFEEQHADTIDWDQFPPMFHQAETAGMSFASIWPLLIAAVFMGTLSIPFSSKL